jgi:dehydrogenase/reductase SDR family protein 12
LLEQLNLVDYGQAGFNWWLNSMYIAFLCYYDDLFKKFINVKKHYLMLLGFLGGMLAYRGGAALSPMAVQDLNYYLWVGLSWSLFFPLSLWVYHTESPWQDLLDRSVIYSFDRSGFLRHQRQFEKALNFEFDGPVLITGGSSGIGLAVAQELERQGKQVLITGRDRSKGDKALSLMGDQCRFISCDLSDWREVQKLALNLPEIQHIVLNAGGMPGQELLNEHGIEHQFASQVIGHTLLVHELDRLSKIAKQAKIIWVSSGGMYLKRLEVDQLEQPKVYDKVQVYANVKRAQVELLHFWHQRYPNYRTLGMHPGWVDTPALSTALPGFNRFFKSRLRTPSQGADTIIWQLSDSSDIEVGGFYFDRKKVSSSIWPFQTSSQSVLDLEVLIQKSIQKASENKGA